MFAEYYTYQAPGEPKFVLQPGDGLGYDLFIKEAEALWHSAKPHNLNVTNPGSDEPRPA